MPSKINPITGLALLATFFIQNLVAQEYNTGGPGSLEPGIRKLYASDLTVLKNDENLIPIMQLDKKNIASVVFNRKEMTPFQEMLARYTGIDNFQIDGTDQGRLTEVMNKLKEYDLIITGLYDRAPDGKPGSIDIQRLDSLNGLISASIPSVSVLFAYPTALAGMENTRKSEGLIVAYNPSVFCEELSAQLIFGGISASGKLPVTVSRDWPSGFGLSTKGNIRLSFGYPENVGISSEFLNNKIDSIVKVGLDAKAFPGCEIMVAKDGMVIFNKCYGFHTYDSLKPVKAEDLYDLASVTKVSSTLAGLMLLDGQGKFSTENSLGYYLPYYRWSNKNKLPMLDILTHQAGLTSWIPFWKGTTDKNGNLKHSIYRNTYSEKFPYPVADSLFIRANYRKTIFREIRRSPIGEKVYLYSDLAFIMSTDIIEKLTGEKWNEYVTKNVYKKLGAFEIGFNPYKNYSRDRIIPTEYDSLFRKQLLHGYVHDEGAAMLNGISGHAGLFATANDLIKLMEMYRRMGSYGGEQIIDSAVLKRYTQYQFPENDNRRGIGFDKPAIGLADLPEEKAYPTKGATTASFGHSGFTGTWVWMDPEYGFTYVFLSNRVNPTRENNKLSELNIRTEILQTIYDSIDRE